MPRRSARNTACLRAANYAAEAWLNGERLGTHEGGFTPFAFEVTGLLRASGNRLVIGVDSTHTDRTVPPPVTDWETYGGITRPVRLIEVPETFVDDAWVRLTNAGRIAVDVAALAFPMGMSAAADDPKHAAARVSVVSTLGYISFLAGPPLLGYLGDLTGIHLALLAILAPILLALLLAGVAKPLKAG